MLTQDQLDTRKTRLAASDFGSILGLNPYKNAADLALEKRGLVVDPELGEAVQWGNRFERPVLEAGAEQIGAKLDFTWARTIVSDSHPWLCATPDAGIEAANEGAEGKTAGIKRGFVLKGEWGDDDSGDVPTLYHVQAQIQMAVTGWELVHLFALIAGRGLATFRIERNDGQIGDLLQIGETWHRRHIVNGDPVDETPSFEVLRRVVRVPKSLATVERFAVEAWEFSKSQRSYWEQRTKEWEREILAKLGTAEGAELPDGRVLTYYETTRKGYTVEPTTYRQLKLSKALEIK